MKTILVLLILFSLIALPALGELTTEDLEQIRQIVKAADKRFYIQSGWHCYETVPLYRFCHPCHCSKSQEGSGG